MPSGTVKNAELSPEICSSFFSSERVTPSAHTDGTDSEDMHT